LQERKFTPYGYVINVKKLVSSNYALQTTTTNERTKIANVKTFDEIGCMTFVSTLRTR
jgi:hypothetical protein